MIKLIVLVILGLNVLATQASSSDFLGIFRPYNPYREYYEQKLKEEATKESRRAEERYNDPDPDHKYYGDLDEDRPEVISFGREPRPVEVIICGYTRRGYDCKTISDKEDE